MSGVSGELHGHRLRLREQGSDNKNRNPNKPEARKTRQAAAIQSRLGVLEARYWAFDLWSLSLLLGCAWVRAFGV